MSVFCLFGHVKFSKVLVCVFGIHFRMLIVLIVMKNDRMHVDVLIMRDSTGHSFVLFVLKSGWTHLTRTLR